mgnify:CR=1 FL=1
MIERKAEKKVKNWIARGNDALLITGARQIGKTYLIRECLEKSKMPYIELNFIEQPELVELFAGAKDADDLLMRLRECTEGLSCLKSRFLCTVRRLCAMHIFLLCKIIWKR